MPEIIRYPHRLAYALAVFLMLMAMSIFMWSRVFLRV